MLSMGSKRKKSRFAPMLSCAQFFATPWTVAHQTLSMGFSRQESRVGCHLRLANLNNFSDHWDGVCVPSLLVPGSGMIRTGN